MGFSVVIKLLGKSIGYQQLRPEIQKIWKLTGTFRLTDLEDGCFLVRFKVESDFHHILLGGPWVVYGHYLSVQAWAPGFRSQEHQIKKIVGWIQLPRLSARYYHKRVVRTIDNIFGRVLRVDYHTESGEQGKFDRMAVEIDLTKPLIPRIQVDDETILVEYENLPMICFHCGRYGHLRDSCPETQPARPTPLSSQPEENIKAIVNVEANGPTSEEEHFGAWMQVQRKQRFPAKGMQKPLVQGNLASTSGSRFDVLRQHQPLETTNSPNAQTRAGPTPASSPTRHKNASPNSQKKPVGPVSKKWLRLLLLVRIASFSHTHTQSTEPKPRWMPQLMLP